MKIHEFNKNLSLLKDKNRGYAHTVGLNLFGFFYLNVGESAAMRINDLRVHNQGTYSTNSALGKRFESRLFSNNNFIRIYKEKIY